MKRPNILIFMTDQQRADSVTGAACLTPNLDRFRREAVTFTNAFCPSPHCCPSRATFMSGLYPSQHGVWHNVNVTNAISRGLAPGVRLWSEDLAAAGYAMEFVGKWHVSAVEKPDDRGWRSYPEGGDCGCFTATPAAAWADYRRAGVAAPTERGPGEIIRPGWNAYTHYGRNENPFGDNDVTETAVGLIRARRTDPDRPWCRFIGTLGPHDPYRVPQRFLDLYDPAAITLPDNFRDPLTDRPGLYRRTRDVFAQLGEDEHREAIRHYLAFCSYEDHLFGRVLDALEETGELDRTLVVYTSDHGDYAAEHGLWCKGLPCFQGAYRVPLVIGRRGGLARPGTTNDALVSLADFAPTVLEAAGIAADRAFYGRSLMPFLTGTGPEHWREQIYTQSNGNEQYGIQRSVMNRQWKYVYNGFDYDELYDLERDPGETVNLAGRPEYAAVVRELCAAMWREGARTDDNCVNPYIMVGFAPVGPGYAFAE